jgi:hypothetical protein
MTLCAGGRAMMGTVSILYILLGVLIIVTRGPLIIAPRATLDFYRRLMSTNAGVRGLGLVTGVLGAVFLLLPLGPGNAAGILRGLGWLWVAATVWLLSAPNSYRLLANSFIDTLDDEAIGRILGLFAVVIGAALIYVGLYAV